MTSLSTMKSKLLLLTSLTLSGLLAPLLRAHSLWIEPGPGNALVVRFGEPGEVLEKSPGPLDRLSHPAAWVAGPEGKPAALPLSKHADHFLIENGKPEQGAFVEMSWPVSKPKEGDAVRPLAYLRWLGEGQAATPQAAVLTLDIVPTGATGEFQVLLRGEPLPKAKLHLHTPGEAERELEADDTGKVTVPGGKPGLCLLSTRHREEGKGFAGGLPHGRVGHSVTVSWVRR